MSGHQTPRNFGRPTARNFRPGNPPKNLRDFNAALDWLQRQVFNLAYEARKAGRDGTFLAAVDRAQKGLALAATVLNQADNAGARYQLEWKSEGNHPLPKMVKRIDEQLDQDLAIEAEVTSSKPTS